MNETKASGGEQKVTITESAARRIAYLLSQEDRPNLRLRVSVSGGGCSGFQYGFDFDEKVNDDDLLFQKDGAAVVIDELSVSYMAGAQIDFVEDLVGAAFAIRNPNASSSCGCGNSFSLF
jgi:iron-sulfur cluster insertion protein